MWAEGNLLKHLRSNPETKAASNELGRCQEVKYKKRVDSRVHKLL